MSKNKIKKSLQKDTKAEAETKPDPNTIKVDLDNAPLVTVKMLEAINNNLRALAAYLKHRDIEAKKNG